LPLSRPAPVRWRQCRSFSSSSSRQRPAWPRRRPPPWLRSGPAA